MLEKRTGYPSIDRQWLKYYDDEVLKSELPKANIYGYLLQCIKEHMDVVAIDYESVSITYGEIVSKIDAVADSLTALGIKEEKEHA